MAKQELNTGTTPNDGTGDTLRVGAGKINSNFTEIYDLLGNGTALSGVVTSLVAGSNISLSGSTGIVTITSTAGGSGITTADVRSDTLSVSGVSTFTGNSNFGGNATLTSGDLILSAGGIMATASSQNLNWGSGNFYFNSGSPEIGWTSGNGTIRAVNASGTISIKGGNPAEDMGVFRAGGAAELYYDNSKKFETLGTGVTVTGTTFSNQLSVTGVSTFNGDVKFTGSSGYGTNGIFWDASAGNLKFNDQREAQFGNSQELRIYRSINGNSYIQDSGSGDLRIISNGNSVSIQLDDTETMGKFITNGAVELYYDNSKKFETTTVGVVITGIATVGIISATGNAGVGSLAVTGVSTFSGITSHHDTMHIQHAVHLQFGTDDYRFYNTGETGDMIFQHMGASQNKLMFWQTNQKPINFYGDAGGDMCWMNPGGSVDLYYSGSKKFETTQTGTVITGICTATSFSGDGSNVTAGRWVLGANGTNHYTFTGPGGLSATDDPTIYLARGQRYEFVNEMGAHPFRIQSTVNGSTGTQYNTGVTNNDISNGTLIFEVPFAAPNSLYYQCTSHGNMGGSIVVYPSI